MSTTNGATYRSTILNHLFSAGSLTPAATVYIGYSTDTVTSGSATECVDSGYTSATRPSIAFTTSSAGSAKTNSNLITFGTANSGHNVTGVALFDAASAGNQLTDWKAVTATPVAIAAGQAYRLPIGNYSLSDVWS